MTITYRVKGAFYNSDSDSDDAQLIRLAPNAPPSKGPTRRQGRRWTNEEHDRFLQAMEMYPSGPWKDIADHVGTRSTRQTMTHAQKYRQKIARWKRGATIKPLLSSPSRSAPADRKTLPSSPQAPEDMAIGAASDANEDATFWQALEDIFQEAPDAYKCEESMISLLHDSQPIDFAMAFDFMAYDTTQMHEEMCV